MNCRQAKKKISDFVDGRLSEKQKGHIEEHLTGCPVCREYKKDLEILRAEARRMERSKIPPEYTQDFSARLKRKLQAETRESGARIGKIWRWKWALGSAGMLVLVFVILYFAVLTPPLPPTEEYFVLSFEETLSEIYGEIETDRNLEELFNSFILASIGEALEDLDWDTESFILMNPLYRNDISESEWERIEEGMKKNTES